MATAVVYSNYWHELETGGQCINQAGRVNEVFVLRKGQWETRAGTWTAENRIPVQDDYYE